MTEPVDLEEDESANLEAIFNHYLLLSSHEDIAHDEKLKWLDLFLCRAISELSSNTNDDFIANFCNNSGQGISTVATRLVADLAIELRHVCLCFDKYKDPRPLRSYVFEGRGWKILYLLSRIQPKNHVEKTWISNLSAPLNLNAIQAELTIKDLVELILNLYQLSMQNITARKSSDASKSAVDYWENALMVSRRDDETMRQWVKLSDLKLDRVYEMWSDLSSKYSKKGLRKVSRLNSKFSNTARKHRKFSRAKVLAHEKIALNGFPSSLYRQPVEPSNLSGFEPRSTESEAISAATCVDHEAVFLKAENFRNPMDFEYFEKLVRSEDEAQYQMEWVHSLQGRLGDKAPQFLDPKSCCSPDHSTIYSMPVCGFYFCRIVVILLIQIVESEIRSRNLKTSFELSLLLTQFSCEELTKLMEEEIVENLNHSDVQELRKSLVILALTSLSEVQFYEDNLKFLQRTNVLSLCLGLLTETISDKEGDIQDVLDLSLVLLTVTRTFHDANNRLRKLANYTVCNLFCEGNGPSLVENSLKMAVDALRSKSFDGQNLGQLIIEVSRFLSSVGVCETKLSFIETCFKRSVGCLSSLYATLICVSRDLFSFKESNEALFQTALESLHLVGATPCISPIFLIDRTLPTVIGLTKEIINDSKSRLRLFRLIEAAVKHASTVHHSYAVRVQPVDGSLSDSDSAFYASDASENRDAFRNYQYLSPYIRLLEKDINSEENARRLLKQTLDHLEVLMKVAGPSTKMDLVAALFLPTLETWLKRMVSNENLSELSIMITQRMMALLQTVLDVREIIILCNSKKIFAMILEARKVEAIRSDIFAFVFTFASQEIHQALSSAVSLESLTVWSGIEEQSDESLAGNLKEEHRTASEGPVSHQKIVYKTFNSNETVNQILTALEERSRTFLIESALFDDSFEETLALWTLQEKLVRLSSDYALFFVQSNIVGLFKPIALKCIQKLSSKEIPDRLKLSLVQMIGTSLSLLVRLKLENFEAFMTKQEHDDLVSESLLAEILEMMKTAILVEHVVESPIHVRIFLDKLLKASTSPDLHIEHKAFVDSTIKDHTGYNYDADGSESGSDDERPSEHKTYFCRQKIVHTELLKYLVEIIEGLALLNLQKFDGTIESSLAKLMTLCYDENNVKILLDVSLPLLLLQKLSKPLFISQEDRSRISTLPETFLELVTSLCSHKMTRLEFRAFIDLFKASAPLPTLRVKQILKSLDKIATGSAHGGLMLDQPSAFITLNPSSVNLKTFDPGTELCSPVCHFLEFPLELNDVDIFADSCFSLAFWIQKRNLQSKCTVFEVACKGMKAGVTFECGTLQVSIHCGSVLLGSATFPFKWHKTMIWNHVILMLSAKESGTKVEIQVAVNSVFGEHNEIQTGGRADRNFLGQSYFALCGRKYYLDVAVPYVSISSLFCFYGLPIDPSLGSLLFALGPDRSDLTFSCLETKSLFFKRLLMESPDNMRYVLPWNDDDQLVKAGLLSLRQHLLFIMQADNPAKLLFFKPSTEKESSRNGLSIFESWYNVASKSSPSSIPATTRELPDEIESICSDGFLVERPWQFWQLVSSEGGVCSLLLLLARTVELGCEDFEISVGLDICFKTMLSSPNMLRESTLCNPILLITRILRSEICKAGLHTVSTMIKHSVTEPLIFYDEKRCVFQFCYDSKAVISDQSLFESIFDCWKMWSKNSSSIDHEKSTSCLEALLKSCAILLRDDHPYRELNVETFRRMNFIKKVSYVLKSDTENVETSNASVVFQIVDLLSALVGSPPDLTVVQDLMDMALLLHDTRQTFVAHSKSNFYFLLGTSDSEAPTGTTPSLHATNPSDDSSKEDNLSVRRHSISGQIVKEHNISDTSLERKSNSEEGTSSEDQSPDFPSFYKSHDRFSLKSRSDAANHICSKKELTAALRKKSVFERPEPWGLPIEEVEDQEVDLADGSNWCEGTHVIEGVLNILFNVMQNLPDPAVIKVVNEIVLPEYILVLCNHDCANVRSRSIRLLSQYINRTLQNESNSYRFIKMDGYILLANQLNQFNATEAVVDACLSIIHNRPITLEECPEIPWHLTANIRVTAVVPILALLPKSVHNIALAHGMILHVHELCAKVPGVLRDHKAIGLFESLTKTVLAIAQSDAFASDLFGQDGREILFGDIFNLFRLISIRFITSRGMENFKSIEELLLILMQTLWKENLTITNWPVMEDPTFSQSNLSAYSIRRCLCTILEECLLQVENKLAHLEPVSHQGNNRRSSELDIYTVGTFPLEEVTDLLLRTVSPRGSVSNDDIFRDEQKRKRNWFQDSSGVSESITSSSPSFVWNPCCESLKQATKSELLDRFVSIIIFSVDFIVDFEPDLEPSVDDVFENFFFSILAFLMSELNSVLHAEKTNTKIRTIFSSVRVLRSKLLLLINFCLFPGMPNRIKIRLLRMLNTHPGCSDILSCLLRHYPDQHRILICFMRRLVQDSKNADPYKLEETDLEDCASFCSSLENWNVADTQRDAKRGEKLAPSSCKEASNDDEIVLQFANQIVDQRILFRQHCKSSVYKLFREFDEMADQVTAKAVEVTKIAMKAQDEERKKFMANIRDTLSEKVRARVLWQTVIEGATHELGLWHFPEYYPKNWKLDEMEGAQRMRIRTQRSFSDIPDKFYLQGSRPPTRKSNNTPFGFLLQAPSGMSGVIVAQLNSRDRIRHMDQCSLVLPSHEIFGEILLSDHSIYFVESINDDKAIDGVVSITVKLEDIKEIHLRWWQLTDCAFEMFLSSGCTKFFVFADRVLRNKFANQLYEIHPRLSDGRPDLSQVTKLWQEGVLTNFDYLMHLNKLAGRTFNDLMQYPTFPFILADYTSKVLDLRSKKSFRNLKKPISVQDPSKEQRFVNNYNVLSNELSRSHEISCPGVGPYHYGSHYSNTGVVLHYLVRIPPFTSMFIHYQDGHFDLADRSFHSLLSAWELASGKSSTDVKELIPDLFYLPELLVNGEGFNFGSRQNGDRVDNVILPPWAAGDPRKFIKIHRQALESEHVRVSLNHWIDLVFGYKQTGVAAVEAINVFHPATYYGFDLSSIEDPDLREARATMIKTYGQTPKQLFKTPHSKAFKEKVNGTSKCSDLNGPPVDFPTPLDTVLGLKWGNYVGSPSQPRPIVTWSTKQSDPVKRLVSAANNEVYGVCSNSTPIIKHNLEGRLTPFMSVPVLGACLVSWGYYDRHMRIKLKKNCDPEPFLALDSTDDRITTVNVCTDAVFMWVGYASGKIVAIRHSFRHKDLTLELHQDQHDGVVPLYGHLDAIHDIAPCQEFGISVSASSDKSCVIWDLRKPSFVRKVPMEEPARLVCVSRASGDFAVVSSPPVSDLCHSTLSLFSINGDRAASRRVEPPITAIAMSSTPEGSAINVIATGHIRTGVIRLWSSWDLSQVCDLDTRISASPITAVTFSFDNQSLFAANLDGDIVLIEKASRGNKRPPKYLNLSAV